MEHSFTNSICTDNYVTGMGGKKISHIKTARSIYTYLSVHKSSGDKKKYALSMHSSFLY